MESVIQQITNQFKKAQVVDVRSGDTVKVQPKIKDGSKERIQIYQGLVIRTDTKGSLRSGITVRSMSSGVGDDKSFLLHTPLVTQVDVTQRS